VCVLVCYNFIIRKFIRKALISPLISVKHSPYFSLDICLHFFHLIKLYIILRQISKYSHRNAVNRPTVYVYISNLYNAVQAAEINRKINLMSPVARCKCQSLIHQKW